MSHHWQSQLHSAGSAYSQRWIGRSPGRHEEAVLRQAVRDSSKVQIFEPDDLLHHLATAWPRQVIQGLDFLTCNLGIITQNLTSVESKWNDLGKTILGPWSPMEQIFLHLLWLMYL